jgi:hypothetical protein
VWVDPNQVIADDDEGHLFRVPFTTDDNGNVTFGDPVRVMQEFRDLPAVAASAWRASSPLVSRRRSSPAQTTASARPRQIKERA